MGFLKYVWGCANEIQQILWLASVPHVHPTQKNGESLITRRQACTCLGQSERLLLLMCVLFGFEMACGKGRLQVSGLGWRG